MADDTWIRELVETEPEYTPDEILSMEEMPKGMLDRFNKAQKRSRINLMTMEFAFNTIKYVAQMRMVLGGHCPNTMFHINARVYSKRLDEWRMKSGESLTAILMKENSDGNFTIDFKRQNYSKRHTWEGFRVEGHQANFVLKELLLSGGRGEHISIDRGVIIDGEEWNGVINECGCCKETHVPMKQCSMCHKATCSIHYHTYEKESQYSYARGRMNQYRICEQCLSKNPISPERYIRFGPGDNLIKESDAPQWLRERVK